VCLLCGLWHGASWPFVLWGAWHGLFLVLERAGLDRALARQTWIAHGYALAAIMGGWVLFRCDTLAHAGDYYAALFGLGAAASRQPFTPHLDGLVATTLTVGILFATPLAQRVGAWRDRVAATTRLAGGIMQTADILWLTVVFGASAAMLAANTYNPFIYFRF